MKYRMKYVSILFAPAMLCCAGAVRQEAPNVSDVTARNRCESLQTERDVFVVDLKPEVRMDLEQRLQSGKGVAVAANCTQLRILHDCFPAGAYKRNASAPKRELVNFAKADALGATLPFGAIQSLQASGSVDRDSGLSLDMSMNVLIDGTTIPTERSSLKGECAEATHIVRRATLGAFSLRKGSKAAMEANVGVAGVGARASDSETKETVAKEGDPEACATGKSTDCNVALRVQLASIQEGPKEVPLILTMVDVHPEALQCGGANETRCQTECAQGNGLACFHLAFLYGSAGPKLAPLEASRAARRGCDLKNAECCAMMLAAYNDPNTGDKELAATFGEKACSLGSSVGCFLLASMYDAGTNSESPKMAKQTRQRGCKLENGRHKECCQFEEYAQQCKKP
jgi:hypothetical protein